MRACGAVKVDGQKQRRERHEMDCMLGEGDGETSAYAERRIVYDRVYAVRRRVSGEKIRVAAYCPNAVSAQSPPIHCRGRDRWAPKLYGCLSGMGSAPVPALQACA